MDVIKKVYQYAEPNLTIVGWLGAIGYPLYFILWEYIFPQPYESLPLRIIAGGLFVGMALRERMPKHWQPRLPYLYFATCLLCLPFFFGYLLLMNGWSTVWAMSFMAQIFLHILLVNEPKVMIFQSITGVCLAYLAVYVFDGQPQHLEVQWVYLPIFVFTYVFGNLFNFRNRITHEAKVSIARSFGAGIAHEMRNPFSALKSSIDLLKTMMPEDRGDKTTSTVISANEVAIVNEILTNASEVIRAGNETIDLLLTSIDQNRIAAKTFKKYDATTVVQRSLDSFAYKRPEDRKAVSYHVSHDFEFFGSDTLLQFTLYNLLKNAFYYQNSEHFHINIELKHQGNMNVITVRDNGVGIESHLLEEVFKDFYTFGKKHGYGLGLPFCRKVMKSFGGNIYCSSVFGEWTEFTLCFPPYDSDKIELMKSELLRSKNVLYVGRPGLFTRVLEQQAFYKQFHLHVASLQELLLDVRNDFESDLVIVDLEQIGIEWDKLELFNSRLNFGQSKIAYLYDSNHFYPIDISSKANVFPLEYRVLQLDTDHIIDLLLFDSKETITAQTLAIANEMYEEHEQEEPIVDAGSKRVLIVDDNHSLRAITVLLLRKMGFDVLEARDGKHAIEVLDRNDVDLVLMDIEMPIMDGLEATQAIRLSNKRYRQVPIVGYTGDNSLKTIHDVHAAGMDDHMTKPAEKEVLLNTILRWA